MTVEEEFNKWFDKQIEAGLIDFKIDINAAFGTTKEDVMAEILRIEKAIEEGNVEECPPQQTTKCSPAADYIICSCIAGVEIDDEHLRQLLHIEKCERLGYTKEYCDY